MMILFRVDAGSKTGLGHYYRSVFLACHLKMAGHQITFSFLDSEFWQRERTAGFAFEVLPLTGDDAESKTFEYVVAHGVAVYYVDAIMDYTDGFIDAIRPFCKIFFYQNIGPSSGLADVFIYPSPYPDPRLVLSFKDETLFYAGFEYLVFNASVYGLPKKGNLKKKVKKIAIAAGGSDPENTLQRILACISFKCLMEYDITFFFGRDYRFYNELPRTVPDNIVFSKFDHGEILSNDLLVTAFGVSAYEFLALGMPVISYGHNSSNADALRRLAVNTGILIDLGYIDTVNDSSLNNALVSLAEYSKRSEMVRKAQSMIDMDGVVRVRDLIIDFKECVSK
jgi:spore coat polysaccharide biosynthesis predicted glycosyltransferase SpsG